MRCFSFQQRKRLLTAGTALLATNMPRIKAGPVAFAHISTQYSRNYLFQYYLQRKIYKPAREFFNKFIHPRRLNVYVLVNFKEFNLMYFSILQWKHIFTWEKINRKILYILERLSQLHVQQILVWKNGEHLQHSCFHGQQSVKANFSICLCIVQVM